MNNELPRLGHTGRPDREWEVYKNNGGWHVWHPVITDFDDKTFASQFDAIQHLIMAGYLP